MLKNDKIHDIELELKKTINIILEHTSPLLIANLTEIKKNFTEPQQPIIKVTYLEGGTDDAK